MSRPRGPYIPAIRLELPWAPPEGYPRYRSVLGTADGVSCSGVSAVPRLRPGQPCDQPATLTFFYDLPADPYCVACYHADGADRGDAATGILAAVDPVSGLWRATHQAFDPQRPDRGWRQVPFDFDW